MKRHIFVVIVILVCVFLEIILSTHFNLFRIKPNLSLLAVVFFTVYLGLAEGLSSAILAGLLKDALSLNQAQMNFLVFLICALVINYFKKYIYRETILMIFVTAICVSLLNGLLDYFWGYFVKGIPLGTAILLVIAPEIFFTVILSPFVFFYLKRCALKFSI
jgi:rod shape-determining protein MreD